ncbi:hypothetical protein GQ651_17015 [Alphaproteobacteria bacterium GH1-50]|uniref:NrS-1 polymerase-like helicase domain-containing protein n=1 Tax=Kangsaoukella pontilimi TaxID=2691042 RepID=A0A7C9IIT4_9RHOB|nr:primase-helicase family protein [Kangsaoukella pontilimi]MXQ09549.1 hypothetical protein [Kangsaoukella pontilimi]
MDQTIPIWNGSVRCDPSTPGRLIRENGMVGVNSWSPPAYRRLDDIEPDMGKAGEFFDAIFTRDAEKEMFLDWVAWCLQNEEDKPTWAPFLYSEAKGSGKSTLCQLIARLFGEQNAVTLNNVDKLAARFNSTVLASKLVISEELRLKPDSSQGNALKTYITEKEVTVERKGQEAQRTEQCCCFLFTTNHLPLWIEEYDRRYYLIDIDHDGHSTGPHAGKFSRLVGEIKEAMKEEKFLAGLYKSLMTRTLSEGFSAKTLNVVEDATPLMKRVHGAHGLATHELMRDHLADLGQHAVPLADIARIISDELKSSANSDRHIMTKLGWRKAEAKWGGKDYRRTIWVDEGFWIERGEIKGPDGYSQNLAEHLRKPDLLEDPTPAMDPAPFDLGLEDVY